MTWHLAPLAAYDCETTGANPETARIVTATTVRICGAQIEPREWLVDPGIEIPDGAAAIHGITTDIARAKGVDPAEACAEITDELYQAWDRDEPVIIMNAPYDLTVLDREMRRHNGLGINVLGVVIDPMCIDRALDPYRKGKRTLTDLCATYSVKIDGAHDATADALAAARVAWRLAQKYPEHLSRIEDLNDLQTGWRDAWSANFIDYLRKQGKPADDVDGHWPIRPYAEAAS